MKKGFFTCILPAIIVLAVSQGFDDPPHVYAVGERVAVAELFTSEGCSSCPVADETLKEMSDILAKENKPVIGLAFHITYWDHLGWKDPFGQEAFTTRQKKYCETLGIEPVYTPQMVVNGEFEFVGSNPIAFRETVEKVLNSPSPYRVDATAKLQGREISIGYSIDKKPKKELLNVALVEVYTKRTVSRGENKNRTLQHYNVVRTMQTTTISASGEARLLLPDDLDPANAAVVVFVQSPRNMKILGASRVRLSQ